MSKELCFRITVKFIFFSRFLQRFWLVTWITAVNSFPNSVSQIPVPRSLNNIMNLRINNRSILFRNWTCGTQGQQHRGVSEHNNAYYNPSPAHLKIRFIAFFSFFLFLYCYNRRRTRRKVNVHRTQETCNSHHTEQPQEQAKKYNLVQPALQHEHSNKHRQRVSEPRR